ncbi:ABC transporter permease [Tunicatimonas pelagia]|uniref:ABC transporter permease n=1 Tax=Tunicatimonas pelagia TaxID=931531 RepID=UPI002666FA9F|nr:ABC transporter permease [Tunicatimonas pelagia]WKN44376.1 ABC transporter permease [Tunicatimonas pelagia]
MSSPDNPSPPRWLLRFFHWYCHPDYVEDIEGDLRERYERNVEERGEKAAYWRFTKDVVKLFRPGIIRPFYKIQPINHTAMFQNYFKIGWRNLLKHKGYSLINIGGLAVGMAVCILIVLYVKDELSFDRFHTNAGQIYRIAGEYDQGGDATNRSAITTYLLASDLEERFSAIEEIVRIDNFTGAFITYKDQQYTEEEVYYVDSTFLDVFSFSLLEGDARTALDAPNSVILSQTMVEKYFGQPTPAVGKTLTFFDTLSVVVTGVMENMPSNSHLQADFLVSMKTVEPLYPQWVFENRTGTSHHTYIQLTEKADPRALATQINQYVSENEGEGEARQRKYFLQALTDIHLHSALTGEISPNGDIQYVYLFSVVALLIVLIASINYINLATAYAIKRSREVGVRRALGALKKQLIVQFLSEATLVVGIALVAAGFLAELSMPLFREITGKETTLNLLSFSSMSVYLLLIALGVGLLAGSYPAFFISSFPSVDVIKGHTHSGSGIHLVRKGLVAFQFIASILLLTGAMVVFKQLNFLRHENLGITTEQVVLVPLPTESIQQQYETLKTRLLEDSRFISITAANAPLTQRVGGWRPYWLDGSEESTTIPTVVVEQDFFATLEATFVSGRDFSPTRPTDVSEAFIINESAQKFLELESPVGTPIIGAAFTGSEWSRKNAQIIGVVEDFHLASLHTEIQPMIFSLHSEQTMAVQLMAIRVEGNLIRTIQHLEATWQDMAFGRSLSYSFMDEDVYALYQGEERFLRIFTLFSMLALGIGGLGVYGLASFVVAQRTKEIGIRKVLGATVSSITMLLSRDFTKLILIAFLVAAPIGYFIMNRWLENFAYRVDIGIGILITTSGIVLLITLLTVCYQSVKAALANPVDSLRNE